jgi:hypothetical protein
MDRIVEPVELVRSLVETTARFGAVAGRLSAVQLEAAAAPGGWSLNEILWHVRASADVYGEHIARMLDEDEPRWRHVSPRARMKKVRYNELPFAESFAAFTRQRAELVALLGSIAPEAWQRVALVQVEKRETRLTLHARVHGMVQHEQVHCAQVEELAAVRSRGYEFGDHPSR